MPFDFAPQDAQVFQGQTAFQDGLAAEEIVANEYVDRGYRLLEQRWRGRGGEIDLVFKSNDGFVFVEVKKARTHDLAAERLSVRQLGRIAQSAEDYAIRVRDDPFAEMRFDLATVDSVGSVDVRENLTFY